METAVSCARQIWLSSVYYSPPINHFAENFLFYTRNKSYFKFIHLFKSSCQSFHGELAVLPDKQILLLLIDFRHPVNHSMDNLLLYPTDKSYFYWLISGILRSSMENLLLYPTDKSYFYSFITVFLSIIPWITCCYTRQTNLTFIHLFQSSCQSFHGELAVIPDRQILSALLSGLLSRKSSIWDFF